MKQPTKFSLAGLVLAVLAALLYPLLGKGGPAPAPPAAPAAAQREPGEVRQDPQARSRPDEVTAPAPGATARRAPDTAPEAGDIPARPAGISPAGAGVAPGPARAVGFTSERSWREHFTKHGAEFGDITAAEYLAMAQALRDTELSTTVLEQVRDDRVITRFDRSSGAFIAFHEDASIRTFFRPRDGEAYFRRQAQR